MDDERPTRTLREEDIRTRRRETPCGAGREALERALRRMRRRSEEVALVKREPDVALAAE